MSGFSFKSRENALRSPFVRLIAGQVFALPASRGPSGSKKAWSVDVSDIEGRALAGLEEALHAARETSEVIEKVVDLKGEIKRANFEAAQGPLNQLSYVESLAAELHERGLRERLEAGLAHRLTLSPQQVQRFLD